MNENERDRNRDRAEQVEDPERTTTHGDRLNERGEGMLADEAIRLGAVQPPETDADDDADPDLPMPAPGEV